MNFRRAAPAPSELPVPMTEVEVLLEHANIMRKLAADMASQHLTLMLVGDGSVTCRALRSMMSDQGSIGLDQS